VIRLNEVRANEPGADNSEYVEIFSDAPPETLTGLTLIVLGDGAGGSGVIEAVVDLGSLTANDSFFVIAEDTFELGTADFVTPLNFENTDNVTFLIVRDFTGANGDDLDGDDDGTLEIRPWAEVIDGVSLLGAEDFANLDYSSDLMVSVVDGGDDVPFYVFRDVDGTGMWTEGNFDPAAPDSNDSPGVSNVVSGEVGVTFDIASLVESDDSNVATGTVVRTGSGTTGDLTVTLTVRGAGGFVDRSELSVPETVVIPDGQESATFTATAVDDLWPDGDQTVTVEASAVGIVSGSGTIGVTDDAGDSHQLVINEIYADPIDDANGDGVVGSGFPSGDEFVEFVNISGQMLDISGWTFSDRFGDENTGTPVTHTFPAGTVLGSGCAIVVFGSGILSEGPNLNFGTAIVQNASNGSGLFLDDITEGLTVRNTSGTEIFAVAYENGGDFTGSLTLDPDLDLVGGFQSHFIETTREEEFSPGRRVVDGSNFCTIPNLLALGAIERDLSEDQGAGAGTLTIQRGGTGGDLVVTLESGDTTELTVPAMATIPDGSSGVTVDVATVNDSIIDGLQTVIVTASATGFLPTTIPFTVDDDGADAAVTTVFINEVDAAQDGEDTGEFVEIYDGGTGNTPLGGLVLVLFNGSSENPRSYTAIDLTGKQTDDDGFFLVATPTIVPSPGGSSLAFSSGSGNLQNGTDAVAIYVGFTSDFPFNTPPTTIGLVDAVVYGAAGADADALISALIPGQSTVSEGGANNTDAIARRPDGGTRLDTSTYVTQPPTPGTTNVADFGSGYASWATGFPGLTGGMLDDDDNDGTVNQIEYALGLDPLTADSAQIPSPTLNGSGQLALTFTKGAIAGIDPSADYAVEISTDLVTWATEGVTTVNDDATELSVTVDRTGTILFARLRLVLSP